MLPRRATSRWSVDRLSRRCFTLQSLPLLRSRFSVTTDPLPPRRFPGCEPVATPRPCSTRQSVASPRRCRCGAARCSHGLPFLEPRACRLVPATTEVVRRAPEGTWVRPSSRVHRHPRGDASFCARLTNLSDLPTRIAPPHPWWLARQLPLGSSSPTPRGWRSGPAEWLGHRNSASSHNRRASKGSQP